MFSVRKLEVLLDEDDLFKLLAQLDELLAASAAVAYALRSLLGWRVLLYL